jgi:hypothetical protein
LIAVAYAPLGGHYRSYGSVAVNWPPYLNEPLMGLTLVVGLVVFVVGWFWGASARETTA